MPAKRSAAPKDSASTATIGFEAVAKCEVRSASHGEKKPCPFDLRNSAFEDFPVRHALIEADLVDCMVALTGQLLYSRQIPVCLWFGGKNHQSRKTPAVSEAKIALAA